MYEVQGKQFKTIHEVTLGDVRKWLEVTNHQYYQDISTFAAYFDRFSTTQQDIMIRLTQAWMVSTNQSAS
jgi:hypothetical protein